MILAIHGAAGGWDELAIAVVAFAVLWVAVKLAGRKGNADDDDDEDEDGAAPEAAQDAPESADQELLKPVGSDGAHEQQHAPAPPAAPRG